MLPICRTRRKGGWGCCGSTVVTTKTRTRGTRTRGWTVTTKKKMNSRWESSKLLSIHQMQFYAISDWIWFITLFIHPPTTSFLQFETISQPSPAPSVSQREGGGEVLPFARSAQQETASASSSRSSTLSSRPNPPGTLSVSRTSSGRSRKEENQEWDAKLLGKPGMKY